ncbi:MAG: coxB [Bradyrhizobium sp.]|nr:coxB [Bradyrhizobium sp.]
METPLAWLPFWLPSATQYGQSVDILFAGLLTVSLLVSAILFFLMLHFIVKYRESSGADRDHRVKKSWRWEVSWTAATLIAFLCLFVWGARLFVTYAATTADAAPVYVVGQQWMWKVQHPTGQREINELHIPAGRPVRVIATSQDVIHSFFIPAFRIKRDVVPGRYQELQFTPERPGIYNLFCSEYCGTDHARMTGRIVVLTPAAFEQWLTAQSTPGSLAGRGEGIFRNLGCSGCHGNNASNVRAPALEGLFGRPVPLSDNSIVIADERYIRDSILLPRSQIVASFDPVMPSYEGRISEDDLIAVVAYIKSLADAERPPR